MKNWEYLKNDKELRKLKEDIEKIRKESAEARKKENITWFFITLIGVCLFVFLCYCLKTGN